MTYNYNHMLVSDVGEGIFHVQLNRPKQLNAMHQENWEELADVFNKLDTDPNCRVVILSGNGRAFTAGIDLTTFGSDLATEEEMDTARNGRQLLRFIEKMQNYITAVEKCSKPVIAAIHGYCLGGGIDISSACNIRFCSKDAEFSVKETAVGFAADVGSLNRLPKIVGNHSWLYDVCMTARHFGAKEALEQGFVSRVYDTYEDVIAGAKETAKAIASNSPVAVQGTKIVLNYARDHPVDESLRFVALWNMSQAQTDDIAMSAAALMTKGPKPIYSKL